MKKQVNVAAIVEKLPDADRPGTASKFTGPAPDEAKKLVASILSGGREAILELAEMIRDANGKGEKNFKPGYLLHAIALRVGDKGRDKDKLVFTEALASLLGGDNPPPGAQEYLLRELQCAGGPEVVKTLGALLEKPGIWEHALSALVAIGTGAGEPLRKALAGAKGRRRLAILQALGSIRDTASTAALAGATEDKDENTRLVAGWGLARIAAPACVQPVVKAAAKAKSWEKIQANKAALLLAENLAASGNKDKARETCNLLINANQEEDDSYVREIAERIIAGL
ncbi:MAG: HEAT repeat domain-containing protein [Planctomycetota bacterium]|jgi:hypothetical protein|nr:HEAT repeat domain-containing protein [Planctomycetota bacterium]